MNGYAVLTASGSDRVGIVDDVSAVLLDHGCNIEESRMSVLGGEFALILLVSGDQERINQLLERVNEIGRGIDLQMSGRTTGPHASDPHGRPYAIECVSLDTPGIVHSVTGLLRRRGINIDELETVTTGAPFTGAPMFRMSIVAIVPPGVEVGRLRNELGEIASAQDLDISMKPIVIGPEE